MRDFLIHLAGIGWQDALDILLSAYILFRVYALFRGTYVFRVVSGLAILWVFQRVTVSLGLVITSWAIQGVMAVAALIVIVVFRNEIRSVLQARNLGTILWGFPRKEEAAPADTVAEAVFQLAAEGVGALLVIPGRDDWRETVQGGVPWGGEVSVQMIKTVFWPGNPVHDGAAVLEGGRIREVGVILPLSRREDLPAQYGTRHRAAAGLAEKTDALVVVVSEERGAVTVARGTALTEVSGRDELARVLLAHAGQAPSRWGYSRRASLELGLAALVSVVFITGVWFSFTQSLDTLITLEVPVEYVNRDPRMRITASSVHAVRVSLGGSGALIRSLRPEQVQVRVDLSRAVEGPNTRSITPENVSLPPGVILKGVAPPTVEVTLDVPVKRTLPVQVDWVGRLSKDLILRRVKLTPERIEVQGSREKLEGMATLYTEKVPLDKIRASGTLTVKPALDPTFFDLPPGSPREIVVEYEIVARKAPDPNGKTPSSG